MATISQVVSQASKNANTDPRMWGVAMPIPGMGTLILKNYKQLKNEKERECVSTMIELIASLCPEEWGIWEGDVAHFLTQIGINVMFGFHFDIPLEKQDDAWKKTLTNMKNHAVKVCLKHFIENHESDDEEDDEDEDA